MADVKKIATRESYGNALTELGSEMPNLPFDHFHNNSHHHSSHL